MPKTKQEAGQFIGTPPPAPAGGEAPSCIFKMLPQWCEDRSREPGLARRRTDSQLAQQQWPAHPVSRM
jgi:hypothetical protein